LFAVTQLRFRQRDNHRMLPASICLLVPMV
jgi:hypothetical protein